MDYKIRGRIRPEGKAGYVAIATALPSDSRAPIKELQETCSTRAQAVARMRALMAELGVLIRRESGEVLDVQTED